MSIFLTLLGAIIPLYIIILLGYLAGKFLHVKKESIAAVAIYIVTPIVVFNGTYTSQISASVLSLPLLTFLIACTICLIFLAIGKLFFRDSTKNLLAFAAGETNVGYFGLPVAIAVFNEQLVALYTVAILGSILYENTFGFFVAARGNYSLQKALIRLVKLPAVYAFALGLLLNAINLQLGATYTNFAGNFLGAYVVLGMMIIGLGLASMSRQQFDIKFISLSFLAKFLIWPLIVSLVLFIDTSLFGFYNSDIGNIMLLYAIVPIAANIVAFSTMLKLHPEKASVAVLVTTLFALVFIPLVLSFSL